MKCRRSEMSGKHMFVCSLILFLAPTPPCPAEDGTTAPITPRTYLEQALDIMQENALHKNEIAWPTLREQTLVCAQAVKTPSETYTAIAFALSQLKEHHSFLQLPDNLPDQQKQAIYTEIWKILAARRGANGERKPSPFAPSTEIKGHIDQWKGKAFAHVVVPACGAKYAEWEKNDAEFQQFADGLQALVVELNSHSPEGWIVDLRGNGGGNMWPMLAGVGLLLGEAELGTFNFAGGYRAPWRYKGGVAESEANHESHVSKPPFALPGTPPVAVLFDRGTASSGEAVAISFAGRARTRSFGEHTAGFSTSNGRYPLADGAVLFLCNGVEADRTGKLYPDGLDPDVAVTEP